MKGTVGIRFPWKLFGLLFAGVVVYAMIVAVRRPTPEKEGFELYQRLLTMTDTERDQELRKATDEQITQMKLRASLMADAAVDRQKLAQANAVYDAGKMEQERRQALLDEYEHKRRQVHDEADGKR